MSQPQVRDDSQPQELDVRIGDQLRALRGQAQVTQKVLGDACGVSFQQIQKYERGISRIPASNLLKLAQALRVPVAAFFETEAGDSRLVVLKPIEEQLLDAFRLLGSQEHRSMALRLVEDIGRTLAKKS